MERKNRISAINRRNLMFGLAAASAFLSMFPFGVATLAATADDPLPSWNDTPTKKAILDFVARVTTEGSADFVPEAERVATFDNDGTLWAEQPLYTQAFFALDRVKTLAPDHPEWKDKEPFASLLKGDVKAALAGGEPALAEIVMATALRHDQRRVRNDRQRLDRQG